MMLAKRLLHGMQLAVLCHAFNRDDICTARLDGKHRATLDRTAIDVDHAGSALAGIAADVRAGPAEMLANHLHQ